MSDASFNLSVVVEGLRVICMGSEERRAHYSKENTVIDENFDFIVLDYLKGAVSSKLMSVNTAKKIDLLYREADKCLESMDWKEQDAFLANRSEIVLEWEEKAARYLAEIDAHNGQG